MTIDRQDLREPAQYENRSGTVVSLFLNLSDPGRIHTELNSLIRTASKRIEEDDRLDQEQRKSIARLPSDMDRQVRNEI